MDEIDHDIDAILAERVLDSGSLPRGPSARAGDTTTRGDEGYRPPTRNPKSSELTFRPADEARDIAARLDRFSDDAMGATPGGPTAVPLDLAGSLLASQRTGREYLSAEEDLIVAAIRLLTERHRWSPQLFNDTTLGLSGDGDQGRFEHTLSIINTLRATQRLPSGGSVEARWVTEATEQLRSQATGRYVQSSELVLSGTIPLLRGSGSVARESLIQAERDLVYQARAFERFRREYLVSIAVDYFGLIETLAQITNQERQLQSLRTLQEGTAARVAAGRLREFDNAIARNQVLTARSALASLRESYLLRLDRFKVRLGLDVDTPLDIQPLAFDLSEPETTVDAATAQALEFRLDLQNLRDQVEDAKRGVSNAKNDILPDLALTGDVTLPTPDNTGVGGVNLSPEDLEYSVGATFSLPLNRRGEALALRRAMVNLNQRQRQFEEARDGVVVQVRGALRNVELARFRLQLAEQQVEINRRRLEEQTLRIDQVPPQSVVDTENELLTAENARDAAKTDLRTAVLEYLLATDTLRVKPDGAFDPLPGMSSGAGGPADP